MPIFVPNTLLESGDTGEKSLEAQNNFAASVLQLEIVEFPSKDTLLNDSCTQGQ